MNTKVRALSKLGKRPSIQTEDPDASLLVEPPVKVLSLTCVYVAVLMKWWKHAEDMVDLDLDGPPQHRLKTRTNLPHVQSKKRKLVSPVAVGD